MQKTDLRIDILGTSISISTDEKPEYLDTLLSKYRWAVESVQRLSGLTNPLKVAILTGFLLCDDLEKLKASSGDKKSSLELEQLTSQMILRLDEALGESASETTKDAASGDASIESVEDDPHKTHVADLPADDKPVDPPVDSSLFPIPHSAFFTLQNTVKNYQWGSPEWIPRLLGEENISRIPYAELWMGSHPAGASSVTLPDGTAIPLPQIIERDPETFLGEQTAKQFGKLPFLFKLLAVAKPLSIQAHPNKTQAEKGFQRENERGISLDAPNRNYRDANHKPELIAAMTPLAALCGFRKPSEIINRLSGLCKIIGPADSTLALSVALESLIAALSAVHENPFKAFLSTLFSMGMQAKSTLAPAIKAALPALERELPHYKDEWHLCAYFAALHSGDTGILSPLYLNLVELSPNEALYIPSGVLHAYIHGMGVELMADSDNVLRGGLTSKYIDTGELLKVLTFEEYEPEIITAPKPLLKKFSYPCPATDFTLSLLQSSGDPIAYTAEEASIVLVTEGSAVIQTEEGGEDVTLTRGSSIFVPHGNKTLLFSGTFTAFAASR